MVDRLDDVHPMEDPHSALRRQYFEEYLRNSGVSAQQLSSRTDEDARKLLAEATDFATRRITEVDCRAHHARHVKGFHKNE
ncbi:MAG: hypothetical protein ABI643_00270 [Candidatus Doudnabacteria bacterium]